MVLSNSWASLLQIFFFTLYPIPIHLKTIGENNKRPNYIIMSFNLFIVDIRSVYHRRISNDEPYVYQFESLNLYSNPSNSWWRLSDSQFIDVIDLGFSSSPFRLVSCQSVPVSVTDIIQLPVLASSIVHSCASVIHIPIMASIIHSVWSSFSNCVIESTLILSALLSSVFFFF